MVFSLSGSTALQRKWFCDRTTQPRKHFRKPLAVKTSLSPSLRWTKVRMKVSFGWVPISSSFRKHRTLCPLALKRIGTTILFAHTVPGRHLWCIEGIGVAARPHQRLIQTWLIPKIKSGFSFESVIDGTTDDEISSSFILNANISPDSQSQQHSSYRGARSH